MDAGAWKAEVHGVAKNRTRLRDFTHFSLSSNTLLDDYLSVSTWEGGSEFYFFVKYSFILEVNTQNIMYTLTWLCGLFKPWSPHL